MTDRKQYSGRGIGGPKDGEVWSHWSVNYEVLIPMHTGLNSAPIPVVLGTYRHTGTSWVWDGGAIPETKR